MAPTLRVGTTTPCIARGDTATVGAAAAAAGGSAVARADSKKSSDTRKWKGDLRPEIPSLKATCEPLRVTSNRQPGCSPTTTSGRASAAGQTKSSSALSTSVGTATPRRSFIGSWVARYSAPVAPRARIAKGACAASIAGRLSAARHASYAWASQPRSSCSFFLRKPDLCTWRGRLGARGGRLGRLGTRGGVLGDMGLQPAVHS